MTRRRHIRSGPVEVVRPLGVVAFSRRRGLQVAVVSQGGREAVEMRDVNLSPTAAVTVGSHRSTIPLGCLDAVVALLSGVNRKGGR